jgi:uncharacterized protein YkwD
LIWVYRLCACTLLLFWSLSFPGPSYAVSMYGRPPNRYVEEDQPVPSPTPEPPLPPEPAGALLTQINQERMAAGVGSLTLDARESQCSLQHSMRMAREGYLSHDDFPADICILHGWSGENIGESPGDPTQVVLLMNQMMFDEGPCSEQPCTPGDEDTHGHYLNLVKPEYTRVGIGIYTANGTTWLTEDFVQ